MASKTLSFTSDCRNPNGNGTYRYKAQCSCTFSESYSASTNISTITISYSAVLRAATEPVTFTGTSRPGAGTLYAKVGSGSWINLGAVPLTNGTTTGSTIMSGSTSTTINRANHTSSSITVYLNLTTGSGSDPNGANPPWFWTTTDTNGSLSLKALSTYTVSYNANGGSGQPSSQTKTYNIPLTLSSTRPTKSGSTFLKWNTKSGGTGTNYNPGGSYTANANATLYAQWQVNQTYSITYNANGGSGGDTVTTFANGATVYFTNTLPHKPGYRFVTWNTASDGTGTSYGPGTKYTGNRNITVYAIYEQIPNVYNIWVKVNGEWRH